MNQYPDYNSYIKALVLSANDVIATVLLLYEDEGYSPLNIATVSLPESARQYRAHDKNGKALFQRGDLIQIDCKIVEHKKRFFSEKAIAEFEEMKLDNETEGEWEVASRMFEDQSKFALYWKGLELRDLAKRGIEVKKEVLKPCP